MGRGRERLFRCDSCGRTVPRDKAVEHTKGMGFDLGEQQDTILDITTKRIYYCISCAKHRKIFEKKKEKARRLKEKRGEL